MKSKIINQKSKIPSAFLAAALLGLSLAAPGRLSAGGGEEAKPALALADCDKCHPAVVRRIATSGKAHGSKVTCLDCHRGHPPAVAHIIPQCGQCHSGRPHFETGDCLQCHRDPHAPLELQLSKKLTGPCLTCHPEPGRQMEASPSFHRKLACTACHNRHGQIPECLRCHKPHAAGQGNAVCKSCHPAHAPLAVAFSPQTPSEYCGECHPGPFGLLAATTTKHRAVPCVQCHPGRHKHIPACSDCHGQPHAAIIHAKFPVCGDCHGKAHDLTSAMPNTRRPRADHQGRDE
ncbi:MAG: hypothetical protein M0017_05870 [Desulfobacteraceae bacterium]|nr:hypothetical protein [Desulfobacteraceae bacterium]